ncbi:hypothetical protein [Methylobacterium frigidaeris]|uniref:hypothetical protein n=1 Tax=Methylobacterium frigidaeris TaxID=2038277 RepID=UPI001EDEAD5D|nr:hypothetical protein [Methylobacterium frigidaeris]
MGITGIVRDEVSVQAQHEGQYDLDGPEVVLSPEVAEVLTLALHELATNALSTVPCPRRTAWSPSGGRSSRSAAILGWPLRLQKPFQLRQIVGAVARLRTAA